MRNYKLNSSDRERSGTPTPSRSPDVSQLHKSPHEILVTNGSVEAVRIRNVANMLQDFFSIRPSSTSR